MICGFCGHEFDQKDGKRGCGGCRGGCYSVHCPQCNYKNPLELELVKTIKLIFNRNDSKKGDNQ